MFAEQYANKKIFITGHTGFKGSWLSAWLLALKGRLCGFSLNLPTKPALFEALRMQEKMLDLHGDVRNRESLGRALNDFQPEIVFHLAAQALVRRSYVDPVSTFETNMIGTMNILELIRACPSVRAVVVITSDKCYRNDEWVWGYRETDHLGGADPYSASKGCAEFIAHSYFQSFFRADSSPACATVRAGNVIGGGDWAEDRIVPDCVRAWTSGDVAKIRSPWATRPWQHVLEPLSGYLWLGARLLDNSAGSGISGNPAFNPRGQAYNFGPPADVNYPVRDLVISLGDYWEKFHYAFDAAEETAKRECTLLKLCCDKALAHLNWKASLDFNETMRFTAQWYAYYRQNQDNPARLFDYTLAQIENYASLASERGLVWARC